MPDCHVHCSLSPRQRSLFSPLSALCCLTMGQEIVDLALDRLRKLADQCTGLQARASWCSTSCSTCSTTRCFVFSSLCPVLSLVLSARCPLSFVLCTMLSALRSLLSLSCVLSALFALCSLHARCSLPCSLYSLTCAGAMCSHSALCSLPCSLCHVLSALCSLPLSPWPGL